MAGTQATLEKIIFDFRKIKILSQNQSLIFILIIFDFLIKKLPSQNQNEEIKKTTLLSVDTNICTKKSFLRKTKPYCMQWCLIDFDTGYNGGRKDKTKILKGIRKRCLF